MLAWTARRTWAAEPVPPGSVALKRLRAPGGSMRLSDRVNAALREEREFVLTLGGYALEIPGATLVTNERVPVPRFNFVQDLRVGADRQASFFERALDHYFQRALRPTFRVPLPVPPHLDRGLRRFGFVPRADPWTLLLAEPAARPATAPPAGLTIEEATADEVDRVAPFWVGEFEGEEFRRGLEVACAHPNPGESMVPLLARSGGQPVAAALLYTFDRSLGIHAVATQPAARGQGAASALVAEALARHIPKDAASVSIESESPRLERRLESLGFAVAARWAAYGLPKDAQLALPDPGPPQPPRWRPPRT